MTKHIVVLAAEDQSTLENYGCAVEQECETVAEAKKRAKYYLTEEYMHVTESSTILRYSQVIVNGECKYDYFGK